MPQRIGTLVSGILSLALMLPGDGHAQNQTPRHFVVNVRGDYERARAVGFNLADVSTPAALFALPDGVKGILWLGNGYNANCNWTRSDEAIRKDVLAVKDHPRSSNIYFIADEPHPAKCPEAAAALASRSDLIRSLDPRAKTFAVILNGHADPTEFEKLRDATDYVGVDPYPCTQGNLMTGCDLTSMERRIKQAFNAGITADRLVPVFQAFGQSCAGGKRNYYRRPSVAETRNMLALWDSLSPLRERPFDMTYSWASQPRVACPTLANPDDREGQALKETYRAYFAARAAAAERTHRP
jgi:hypothetical protein